MVYILKLYVITIVYETYVERPLSMETTLRLSTSFIAPNCNLQWTCDFQLWVRTILHIHGPKNTLLLQNQSYVTSFTVIKWLTFYGVHAIYVSRTTAWWHTFYGVHAIYVSRTTAWWHTFYGVHVIYIHVTYHGLLEAFLLHPGVGALLDQILLQLHDALL